MKTSPKIIKRQVRRNRIRAKVSGTIEKPRLAIFKSNKYIYASLIDDVKGHTLAESSSLSLEGKAKALQAEVVGQEIAKKAIAQNIKKVVFDRGGYIYTGRVKTLADAARKAGLDF